jgi:hypothetical protein
LQTAQEHADEADDADDAGDEDDDDDDAGADEACAASAPVPPFLYFAFSTSLILRHMAPSIFATSANDALA